MPAAQLGIHTHMLLYLYLLSIGTDHEVPCRQMFIICMFFVR